MLRIARLLQRNPTTSEKSRPRIRVVAYEGIPSLLRSRTEQRVPQDAHSLRATGAPAAARTAAASVVVGDDDDDDDLAGVGPEALEFVYGPDPDLLADVFGLPPDATSDDLDRAYEEQMERADLPSGRHDDVHGFLSPRDFRGIKRDAVRYAYAKLKEGGVRSESGGSGNRDREHGHEGFWKALYADRLRRDEEGTVGTATETDASDAEGGGSPETLADFWSEANCSADGDEEDDDDFDVADLGLLYDVAYGSHGNYSYNCDGDAEDDEAGDLDREETKDGPHFDRDGWGYEDGGEHFGGIRDRELLSQNRDSPSTDNAEGGETFNLFDLDSNQSSAASSSLVGESIDDRDDGSSASKSTDYYHTCDEDEDEDDGSSASKLSNSYRTCDEYEDDEQEPEGEGFDRRHTGASPGSNDWKKQYRSVRSEELHSSTDSIGFDRLIRDSVSDQDYFHQLLPRKRDPPASTDADEQWEAFDPFDLRGSDRSPAASGSEGDGVGTAVSFVCPLPEREVEEEDGLTAGNSMDGLEGVDCFSSKGEHVADEEGLARRGFEPDGSIASTLDDGDGKALAYAAMYDGEDVAIEVETFSNGSSVGSQHSRGDDTADIQLRAASYSSDETTSLPSIKTTDGDDRRPSPPDEERGQKNGQRIDCFPEDKVPGPKTRLNIEEEDEGLSVARGSDNNCFDACVEDVGESMEISFHVVEKFFINLGCCEERTVCQLEGETRSVRA